MADKLADMVVVMVVDTVVADEVRGQRGCRHGRLAWRTDQDRPGQTRTGQGYLAYLEIVQFHNLCDIFNCCIQIRG